MKQHCDYLVITASYWCFMLTDGALRMTILLYLHRLGYTPISLAFILIVYEFFGILTNLYGGLLAHKFGLKLTLVCGLFTQLFSLLLLSLFNEYWEVWLAVPFIVLIQSLSGISKDLTKMSSKTSLKFLISNSDKEKLFKWVAVLTGSKNAIKGIGYFVGCFLLECIGFQNSLFSLSSLIFLSLLATLLLLSDNIGKVKIKKKSVSIFNQNNNIKILSLSRVFLFGARDIWFVVAIPVYLISSLIWSMTNVGSFMAMWIIIYGFIQAITPNILKVVYKLETPNSKTLYKLSMALFLCMSTILLGYCISPDNQPIVIGGLFVFCILFAMNSSVHSFLILDYSEVDRASLNVGYYYMANAVGRFIGTLLSGILYQIGGFSYCLIASALFIIITTKFNSKLSLTFK